MKKGCGSASLWGNGYRGRRPETEISRNSELRHLGKCALFSWLAPPKAGGELALAPERGNRWKECGPSPSLRDTSPRRGERQVRKAAIPRARGRQRRAADSRPYGNGARNSAFLLSLFLFPLHFSLFTFPSSLFTLHFSLFTLPFFSSLFPLHFSLFPLRYAFSPAGEKA